MGFHLCEEYQSNAFLEFLLFFGVLYNFMAQPLKENDSLDN